VSALLGAAVLTSLGPDQRHIAFLAAGMWIGIMLNLIVQIVAIPQIWPVLQEVLEWDKIDDLLDGDEVE
jgi:hypothetical protein